MRRQEVSGLDVAARDIKYRAGDSTPFSPLKMSGLKKFSEVTMERGVVKGVHQFWDWFNEIKSSTIKRKPVTTSLLDESGTPTMAGPLDNA
ncbi:MAG: phage tail protein [Inhella sp.]